MKILIFILILIFIIYNSFQISHFNSLNFMLETEKDKYRFTADTAVSILKPTLTLYYDRYDINSKYFYDDAKVVLGEKIIELISRRQRLIDEYNYLEKTFNEMILSFKKNTKIKNVIRENEVIFYKIKYKTINYLLFMIIFLELKLMDINNLMQVKLYEGTYGLEDLTLNKYLTNFYSYLKNSNYDYSDIISKIKDLQYYVDKKSDIFDTRK